MITWLDTILGRHTPHVPYVILGQKHTHETGQGIWHTHKRMPHTCNKLVQLTVTVSHVFFCGWSIVWSHECNARVSKGLQDDQVGKKVACPAHMRWWSSSMAHIHSCFAPNCSIFSLSLTYTTTARNQWLSRSLDTEDKMVLQCALGCSVTELIEPCSLLAANFKNWPQGMHNVLRTWGKAAKKCLLRSASVQQMLLVHACTIF